MTTTADNAVVNGEVVEGREVVVHDAPAQPMAVVPAQIPTIAVTPQVPAAELVARLNVIREAADQAMTEGVDFGKIPGTDKPTLLKPGAEKLSVLFQLDVQLANEKLWGPGDHLTVISRATVFHAPSGARLGYGEGVCTTRERKYAYRQAQRICPDCALPAIIRGKAEYGGGWLCFRKKGGCGAKFTDDDQRIVGQDVGEIENPDLPDLWNTVTKMAEKRARVDAVLAVTGASALFTQDMEDAPREHSPETPPSEPEPELLADASVNEVLAAISRAKMGTPWVRSQLVAIGAPDVPEGALTKGTIQQLSPEQAVAMVKQCDEAAEAKAASNGD